MEQEEQEAAAAAAADPAAPSAGVASSPGPGPAPMDVDDEDSFVVPAEIEGWDPMDLPPKPGETAHQAARRMELKGRSIYSSSHRGGGHEQYAFVLSPDGQGALRCRRFRLQRRKG